MHHFYQHPPNRALDAMPPHARARAVSANPLLTEVVWD